MLERPVKALMLLFLGGALVEDSALFVIAWCRPEAWFHLFHHAEPLGLDVALLRRAAGQWAAFALVQAIALLRWRTRPTWLLVVAGARVSDLFTDLSYIVAAPSLTSFGWAALLPPPFLNLAFAVTMVVAWRQLRDGPAATK